jgi:hypothetical protein
LLTGIGFPLAANHGRFDVHNESMQPYLLSGALFFIALVFVGIIIYSKPLPNTGLYVLAKMLFPFVTVLLGLNILDFPPMYWGVSSVLIFLLRVFGVGVSLCIGVRLFQNKEFIL